MTAVSGKKAIADAAEAEAQRLRNHPAFGMWADREDMKDPGEWVRARRRRRRERIFGTHASGDAE